MRLGWLNRWTGRLAAIFVAVALAGQVWADEPKLSEYYGFLPVEIYKLDRRIESPRVADFDGDGTGDVLIANNARSRIDLLLSTKSKGKDDQESRFSVPKANELANDRRMRLVHVPVNKAVVSVQIGEFNGDNRPDIVYYGLPAEVVILANEGDGKFSELKKIETADAVESSSCLAAGDLNADGKMDLAWLRPNEIVIVKQIASGKFEDPIKLPHTGTSPGLLRICDIDGENGNDIVFLAQDPNAPLRARLATKNGLGPEQRFATDRLRALEFFNLDGKPGDELLLIDGRTGRLNVQSLRPGKVDDAKGRIIVYPMPEGNARDRSLDVADLDGDGKLDVIASDPANTQVIAYLQNSASGLGVGASYPSLIGVKGIRCGDFDGDGKAEILTLSTKEKQIGLSKLRDNRITFPVPLPIVGEPARLEIADLNNDKQPELLYLTKVDGKSELRALKCDKITWTTYLWGGGQEAIPVKPESTPTALKVIDVNQDGENDIVLFTDGDAPTLLLGKAGAAPTLFTEPLGPLAAATVTGTTLTKLNQGKPSLLVAQESIAREVVLGANKTWTIKDQFNAGRTGARLSGAQALDFDGDGSMEIILHDNASKKLLILANRDKVYRNIGTIDVGAIELSEIRTADLNGDGSEDLLLVGTDKFIILLTGKTGLTFQTIASYESNRKEARLGDVNAGDLNGDGIPDVVLSDLAEHYIELVAYDRRTDLVLGLAFPVFEKKSFRDIDDNIEPREFAIGDIDGDKRQDLVVIAHDRVLIYRQDSGESSGK